MPAQRQQRRNNARGRVQLPNQRPVPDLQWQIGHVEGALVACTIQTDISKLFLQGIPNLRCDTAPGFPILAALSSVGINITLPSVPTFPCRMTLSSADPALRNDQGAFLAALNQPMNSVNANPLPLDTLDWTVTGSDANTVTLSVPGLDPMVARVNSNSMRNNYSGALADSVTISLGGIVFGWLAGAPPAGQQMTWEYPELLTDGDHKQGLIAKAVTI